LPRRLPSVSERDNGALALVLHTHMPYVEGFGTWPFGEEWLWEAMACCYLPLLDVLDRREAAVTVSLTPVLGDQLGAAGIGERFGRFVEETRRFTHEEDAAGLRKAGLEGLAEELERAWREDYEGALARFRARGGDLVRGFGEHVSWTCSATHAVLPLLASDACVRLQLHAGVAGHLERFGEGWRGGLWLPECAHSGELEPLLTGAGARGTCVELTGRLGLGAAGHLRPVRSDGGLVLFPVDRRTISLVWSEGGYPADGAYRDYHRHTVHHHNPWCNGGGAYEHELAKARAREHAEDFVRRVRERLTRAGRGLPGGGLVVCALDTELLGHWWYEGLTWLDEVFEQCAIQGLELVGLDDAAERFEPAAAGEVVGEESWRASSWGRNGDLSTWSGAGVAEMAFGTRAAELATLAGALDGRAGRTAVRELLALQSSDWAFMVSRGIAVPYARERFEGHRRGLERALAAGAQAKPEGLGSLAEHADPRLLLVP
ncbi:MAG TPA: 1,4-alpha-glucan branching protein domain-containing protein, partial [Solirubrobacteraceae bacterium]|nr:1,4-alpha-glucan branching protein domain-containing protein [Solirubrobacteraceae bacterium]